MGYINTFSHFIRNPDVDFLSSSNGKIYSKPLQFFTQFIRNEQNELVNFIIIILFCRFLFSFRRLEEAAAQFAQTFINEITNQTENFQHSTHSCYFSS